MYSLRQMRIMICDDERNEREELARCVRKVWTEAVIDEAGTACELQEKFLKKHSYDLIFLDIYLDEFDGITAGRWIRSHYPDINMVFVSNSREFGPEVFEVNALHYLMKPCGRSGIEEVKRRYEANVKKNAVVHIGTRMQGEIPVRKIVYIESEHNNLQIHLVNGSVLTVRDSLQNYMEKLDERFFRINRGIIVNMEAVDKMNTDSCEIAGKTFMLSRKSRKESRKRYSDYIFDIAVKAM